MAKARQVLKGIQKAGWELIGTESSHRKLRKGSRTVTFSYHDTVELGQTQLRIVAKQFGLTLDELRKLL
jgi:predicted RNA binding protein YcfA (HicA-like mRNA interferase family)